MSDWELKVARNEIYARHGCEFHDTELQRHFEKCSWYKPNIPSDKFDDATLSNTEKANIELIVAEEKSRQAPAEQPIRIRTNASGGYVLLDRSTRRYAAWEVSGLSAWELQIARNEIYARHGYIFNDPELKAYFSHLSWYHPTTSSDEFDDDNLSAIERDNIELILSMED